MFIRYIKRHKQAFKTLAIYEGIIMIIALVITLLAGRFTLSAFGGNLAIVGGALISIGVFSTLGAWGNTRSFGYLYASSAGAHSIREQLDANKKDMEDAFGFFASSTLLGSMSALIGFAFMFL